MKTKNIKSKTKNQQYAKSYNFIEDISECLIELVIQSLRILKVKELNVKKLNPETIDSIKALNQAIAGFYGLKGKAEMLVAEEDRQNAAKKKTAKTKK